MIIVVNFVTYDLNTLAILALAEFDIVELFIRMLRRERPDKTFDIAQWSWIRRRDRFLHSLDS